jgi:hypothetical protein
MLKLKKMIVSPIFSIFFPVTEVLEFVVYTCNIIFVCSDAHFASFREMIRNNRIIYAYELMNRIYSITA